MTPDLAGRLAALHARVAAEVARRRAGDPDPDDRFRGLYIADVEVDRLLAGPVRMVGPPGRACSAAVRSCSTTSSRLARLASTFGLGDADLDVLVAALAPDVDRRFERLYAYLHDDVTRRRASTGLALELCFDGPPDGPARSLLGPAGALVSGGLLLVEEPDRPFLTRSLRVPDRVVSHLLGDDTPDPLVTGFLATPWPAAHDDGAAGAAPALAAGLSAGARLVYVREEAGGAAVSLIRRTLGELEKEAVVIDLGRPDPSAPSAPLAAAAAREARLIGGVLVAGPVAVRTPPAAVRPWAEAPGTVILFGEAAWDPAAARDVPLLFEASAADPVRRQNLWRAALNGDGRAGDDDLAGAVADFRLSEEQVARAARAAKLQAAAAGRPLSVLDLRAGARAQNAAGLERLAHRVAPRAGWDDLVLPDHVVERLGELTSQVRHRERVKGDWGMGRRTTGGTGVTALFAGDSGTGKTLSAEVIANDLGLDLYVIDLSSVIDKYVGETEKNLDKIFAEADRVNGVLLFDEADALFGKRSDVKDSHDRYANVEVAYLLQRMERFDGLAVLTTNLRANLDEAFTRRLDVVVDFPLPEEEERRALWELHLRPAVPRAEDIDVLFLARSFRLSGGGIANVATTAAYRAAAADRAVTMADCVVGVEREYAKLGHLCTEAEFGVWFPALCPKG